MRLRRQFLPVALLVSSGIWGCHPFDRLQGEFNAGSLDPFDFAPAYRTTIGYTTNQLPGFGNPTTCRREVEGSCNIVEFRAFINNAPAGYFRFPFPPNQVPTTGYPSVAAGTTPDTFTPLRVSATLPNAYVFDGSSATTSDSSQCRAPSGYAFDSFRDDVHYDAQGNIFTGLPNATNFPPGALQPVSWSYVPVVQQVPVTSNGEPCQDIKSELSVLTRSDVTTPQADQVRVDGSPTGRPDGTLLAWAIIDPGAPVFKATEPLTGSGLGHQRYGWFNQYLVAYLDGGSIQITGNPPRYTTQRLFYPRSTVRFSCNVNADCAAFPGTGTCETATQLCHTSTACTANGQCPSTDCDVAAGQCRQSAAGTPGQLGLGYDVMESARGSAGYSPVCQVQTYAVAAGTPTANLPRNATDIIAGGGLLPPAAPGAPGGPITPTFMFCLQVQP